MKKCLLLLLPLSIILLSCTGNDTLSVSTYNEKLVKIQETALERIDKLHEIIPEDTDDTTTLSEFKIQATTVADSLKSDIDKINALKRPSGTDEFHNSMVEVLQAYTNYVEIVGNVYSIPTDSITDADLDKMEKEIDEASSKVDEASDKMLEAQKAFAKANNAILQ